MIRLQRVGRKHDPSFRVIVTEKERSAKTGDFVESIGSYDARTDRKQINAERVTYWISKGAQVSDTVHNLLVDQKVIEGKKVNVLPKMKNRKAPEPAPVAEAPKEEPKAEAAAEEAPVAETPAVETPAEAPAETA